MSALAIAQVCADRGIAPGTTKGAAQHLRGIAAGFKAAGHAVTTFSARRADGPFPVAVRDLAELASDPTAPFDVIYERYSLGHRAGLDHARRIGATFVLEVNAPLVDEATMHRPNTVEPHHREVEDVLMAEADLVITVSGPLQRWVESKRLGPCVTIPNGFEPEWFTSASRPASPTLAFIGHPKPWHGADRLPALLQALGARNHRPQLMVIGGGPGAHDLARRAVEFGVADQVTITGSLPPQEASALLCRATIGVAPYPRHPSFYFCPLKIVDYLAAGLPIVSTRQGDIPQLVGDAGVIVDPDDDEALVGAICSLLDDPSAASDRGANGRRRAHTTMTWSQVAGKTLSALHGLSGKVGAQ